MNFDDVIDFFENILINGVTPKDILNFNYEIFNDRVKCYSKLSQKELIDQLSKTSHTGNLTYFFDELHVKLYKEATNEYADRVKQNLEDNITLELPVTELSIWSWWNIDLEKEHSIILTIWVPISQIVYYKDDKVILNAKTVKFNANDMITNSAQSPQESPQIVKSEENVIYAILGTSNKFLKILDGAKFLAGKDEVDEGCVREAFLNQAEDEFKAALVSCGLEPSESNLEALRGILELKALHKPLRPPITNIQEYNEQEYIDVNKSEEYAELCKMALIHDDHVNPKMVYRVENELGEGPYGMTRTLGQVVSRAAGAFGEEGDSYLRQPPPSEDFPEEESGLLTDPMKKPHNPLRFGFESPEHAINWFGQNSLHVLQQHGFNIKKVPASKVYRSKTGKQVMFIPHESYLNKSENDIILACDHKVTSKFNDSRDVLKDITLAFEDRFIVPIQLKGKHTKGILLAREPDKGKVWLLKPGYGKSPIEGETNVPSVFREAAFYQISRIIGLSRFVPPAYAINVDGIDYAAITLLNWDYKTLDYIKRKEPAKLIEIMQPYVMNGDIFKWATYDYITGCGADRHGGNMMVSPKNSVYLIDGGTSFLDNNFKCTNPHCFVPFYLRFGIQDFYKLDPEKKFKYMITLGNKVDDEVKNWFYDIEEPLKTSAINIMETYGIDPNPIINRYNKLKQLIQNDKISNVLNGLWIGLLE